MQILIALLVSAAATVSSASPPDLKRSDPVLVRAVLDGDTIDVAVFGRVRLLGIDAPEVGRGFDTSAPFGKEARDRLTSLVLHRWVRLEQEAPLVDVYDRHLAYVMTETGEFVNATLVREGLARVSARLPIARLAELKRAEAEAQTFRRGMWGEAPQIPAAGYTRPSAGGKARAGSTIAPRGKHAKAKKPAGRRTKKTNRSKKPTKPKKPKKS
jgi:endonuclease YncB( thermonuclease family)